MNSEAIIDGLEQRRLKKLSEMLEWRLRPDASGHQMAEAESLAWALEVINECFEDH